MRVPLLLALLAGLLPGPHFSSALDQPSLSEWPAPMSPRTQSAPKSLNSIKKLFRKKVRKAPSPLGPLSPAWLSRRPEVPLAFWPSRREDSPPLTRVLPPFRHFHSGLQSPLPAATEHSPLRVLLPRHSRPLAAIQGRTIVSRMWWPYSFKASPSPSESLSVNSSVASVLSLPPLIKFSAKEGVRGRARESRHSRTRLLADLDESGSEVEPKTVKMGSFVRPRKAEGKQLYLEKFDMRDIYCKSHFRPIGLRAEASLRQGRNLKRSSPAQRDLAPSRVSFANSNWTALDASPLTRPKRQALNDSEFGNLLSHLPEGARVKQVDPNTSQLLLGLLRNTSASAELARKKVTRVFYVHLPAQVSGKQVTPSGQHRSPLASTGVSLTERDYEYGEELCEGRFRGGVADPRHDCRLYFECNPSTIDTYACPPDHRFHSPSQTCRPSRQVTCARL